MNNNLIILMFCLFSSIHVQAKTSFALDNASGNGISTWETFDSTNNHFVIQVMLLDGKTGSWSKPETISSAKSDSRSPQVAINESGDAAVIWQANDPKCGKIRLCGSTYIAHKQHWHSFAYLSEKDEAIQEDYSVKLSSHSQISVVYTSIKHDIGEHLRAIYCPRIEKWEASFIIAP